MRCCNLLEFSVRPWCKRIACSLSLNTIGVCQVPFLICVLSGNPKNNSASNFLRISTGLTKWPSLPLISLPTLSPMLHHQICPSLNKGIFSNASPCSLLFSPTHSWNLLIISDVKKMLNESPH